MIKCIIVDDEMPAREELKYLLNSIGDVEVLGEASHGEEALALNDKLRPDLIFLDISMPKMNGIDVAKKIITEKEHRPMIIFVTAYEQFAVEAFEVNAVDYLLKPISKDRLEKAMLRIANSLRLSDIEQTKNIEKLLDYIKKEDMKKTNKILVLQNGKLIPMSPSEIIYATVEGRNTVLHSSKGKFDMNMTLGQLEERLDNRSFFRCHKSYLINLDYIEAIEPWFNSTFMIKMAGIKEKIPVSRSQCKEFKKIMDIR